jgi:hypothetical protein
MDLSRISSVFLSHLTLFCSKLIGDIPPIAECLRRVL